MPKSTLCENILHEATHVADVHMIQSDKEGFKGRLIADLIEKGFKFSTAWNVWHALIFVASAQQVRTFIDANYSDYVLPHDLYAYFGVPNLPALWTQWTSGEIDEPTFLHEVAQQLK